MDFAEAAFSIERQNSEYAVSKTNGTRHSTYLKISSASYQICYRCEIATIIPFIIAETSKLEFLTSSPLHLFLSIDPFAFALRKFIIFTSPSFPSGIRFAFTQIISRYVIIIVHRASCADQCDDTATADRFNQEIVLALQDAGVSILTHFLRNAQKRTGLSPVLYLWPP